MFKPLGGNILVEFDEDSEKTKSTLLYKPEGAVEEIYRWATVKAVGPGKVSKKGVVLKPEVKEGDKVLLVRFLQKTKTGESLTYILGKNQLIITEKDIVAVEEG